MNYPHLPEWLALLAARDQVLASVASAVLAVAAVYFALRAWMPRAARVWVWVAAIGFYVAVGVVALGVL